MATRSSSTDAAAIAYAANTRHVAIFAAAGNGGPTAGPSYQPRTPVRSGCRRPTVRTRSRPSPIAAAMCRWQHRGLDSFRLPNINRGNDVGYVDGHPYASGSAADALSALRTTSPRATGRDIVDVLQQSATDLGVAGRDTSYGFGLVNPAAAVNRVTAPRPHPRPPPPHDSTPSRRRHPQPRAPRELLSSPRRPVH